MFVLDGLSLCQVGAWSQGQHPLRVHRSRAVKASTAMDRIKIEWIALLVFLWECVLLIVVVVLWMLIPMIICVWFVCHSWMPGKFIYVYDHECCSMNRFIHIWCSFECMEMMSYRCVHVHHVSIMNTWSVDDQATVEIPIMFMMGYSYSCSCSMGFGSPHLWSVGNGPCARLAQAWVCIDGCTLRITGKMPKRHRQTQCILSILHSMSLC